MKKSGYKKNYTDRIGAFVLTLLLFVATYFCFGMYYRLNDDVLIRDYISGIYSGTPSGHTVYMLYPLGALIAGLYRILPFVPWYGILMLALVALCVYLITLRILSFQETKLQKTLAILSSALFYAAFILKQVTFLHYTVTGGLLMMTACFLFLTGPSAKNNRDFIKGNIIPIILSCISFFIRPQIGLFLLPMLAVSGLLRYSLDRQNEKYGCSFMKRYLPVFLIAAFIMGAGFLTDRLSYGDTEWREFKEFNGIRTELYDYNSIPDYAQNQSFYEEAGITKMQVTLLKNYNYELDGSIDSALIEKINAYNDSRRASLTARLKQTAYEYVHRVLGTEDAPYNYIVIALYVLASGLLLAARRGRTLLPLILLGVTRSVLFCYLLFRGRMTDRITEPLLLCEMMILTALILYVLLQKKWNVRVPMLLVVSLLLAFAGITSVPKVKESAATYEENAAEWMKLQEDLMRTTGEDFYIIDVYSSVKYSERIFDEAHLHRLSEMAGGGGNGRNNEIAGGWAVFSPLMYEKHENYGFRDAYSALRDLDRVRFVVNTEDEAEWLSELYRLSGDEITLSAQRVTGDFTVYKVDKKS